MQWIAGQRRVRAFVVTVLVIIPLCSYYASVAKKNLLTFPARYVMPEGSLNKERRPLGRSDGVPLSPTMLPHVTTVTHGSTQIATKATSPALRNLIRSMTPLPANSSIHNTTTIGGLPSRSTLPSLNQSLFRPNISGTTVRGPRPSRAPTEPFLPREQASANAAGSHVPAARHPVKALLIITAKRSGSSFVGELFNQHPDIFYVFEPLLGLDRLAGRSPTVNESFSAYSKQVLNATIRCDFHSGFPRGFKPQGRHPCMVNSKLSDRCQGRGENAHREWEEIICRRYTLVATKIIRVHDIADLKDLLVGSDVDWRILHLVRDPRPTERSRMKTRPNYNLIRRKGTDSNDWVDLCEILDRNVKFWLNTPDWLRGRYKLVRFEDIASDPYQYAEELLDFAGVGMHPRVAGWIKENTESERNTRIEENTASRGDMILRTQSIPQRRRLPPGPRGNPDKRFSTKRDSAKVLEAWRSDMDWKFVQKIQKACYKPMETLGYAMMPDNETLRNLNVPSTLPLRRPDPPSDGYR